MASDLDLHARLAKQAFNRTWELLDLATRSRDHDDEMLAAAFASRWHWIHGGGTPKHAARGEWQIARVCAVLGLAEQARRHAQRCLELAEAHQLSAFDRGAAREALARAARVAGDDAARMTHLAAARALLEQIEDPEDREILAADLATL